MRQLALFVALAMIAASPALAAQKKKAATQAGRTWRIAQKQNDNSYRFARDALPIFLPSWAQPVYQYGVKPRMETHAANAKPAKKKAKARTAAKTN